MYLTRLKLDPVLRSTRELFINPDLLHKAVYRAFPDENAGGSGRILYRMDIDHENNTNLLIQSEYKPNWDRTEFLKSCLVEKLEPPKLFNPVFKSG
jgi:CRISPR system Cascade subunit CasE